MKSHEPGSAGILAGVCLIGKLLAGKDAGAPRFNHRCTRALPFQMLQT
jgi:hypothetical protein